MAELYKAGRFIWSNWVASNSLSVSDGDLVDKVWGVIVKASNATAVLWIAAWEQSFEADNETVGKEKVEFIKLDDYSEVRVDITTWVTPVDATMEGQGFDLLADGTVDSDSAGTGTTLYLREFVSATEGIFAITR